MDKAGLRAALREVAPWTADPEVGPGAVDAGDCDRCGRRPRFVATCGAQPWRSVCPACLVELGTDLFCDGHREEALRHLATARSLPAQWATITRLAWVATGEISPDPAWLAVVRDHVDDPAVAAALAGPADG